jgi:hypothetical protein
VDELQRQFSARVERPKNFPLLFHLDLRVLGFFQQLRRTKLQLIDAAL